MIVPSPKKTSCHCLLLSFFLGALAPAIASGIVPPLELSRSYELNKKPVGLVGLENTAGISVILALDPNMIECMDREGKKIWTRTVSSRIENISGAGDRVLVSTSSQLVCINNRGMMLWQIPAEKNSGQVIVNDCDGDGEKEILYSIKQTVHILALNGSQKYSFSLPFVPVASNTAGGNRLVFLGEKEILCAEQNGNRVWSFSLPPGWTPCCPAHDTLATFPRLFYAGTEKAGNIVCQVYRTGEKADTKLLNIDAVNGRLKYELPIQGVCLSMAPVDECLYLSLCDPVKMQGFIWVVDKTGSVTLKHVVNANLHSIYAPSFFLRPFYGALLVIPAAGSMNLLLSSLRIVAVVQQRIGTRFSFVDLDRDGDEDILIAGGVPQAQNRFALDFIVNNIPENRRIAEELGRKAQILIKEKNFHMAAENLSLARSIYYQIGNAAQAEAMRGREITIKNLEKKDRTKRMIFRYGLGALALLVVIASVSYFAYPFARKTMRIARVKAGIVFGRQKDRLSVEALKTLESSFLHETKKKLNKLKAAIVEYENNTRTPEVREFLGNALTDIRGKFDAHQPELAALFEKKKRVFEKMASALPSLKQELGSYPDAELLPRAKEIAKATGDLLAVLQEEITARKYSIHDAVNISIAEIEKEKAGDAAAYSIAFLKDVPSETAAKVLYQDEYEQWKNAFVNILRNGFEAVVRAIMADRAAARRNGAVDGMPAVPRRRMVGISLTRSPTDPGTAIITIEDSGCGMDEKTTKFCFSRGYSFGKELGTGLGLNQEMKKFIEEHGGIGVESAVGKGTKFTIEIYNV